MKREHHPLPTLEDIAPRLVGSTKFSVLDFVSGFLQCELHQDSRAYTTFITHRGRKRLTRLPFGISIASEVFQRKMNLLFENETGIEVIIDDILIHGKDDEEHDRRLARALQILKDANVQLNKDKMKLKQTEVSYFGHLISAEGIRPDPDRVVAITNMQAPTNVNELRSMVGMFNFVAKFIPNMSVVMGPMTDLLKANSAWHWGPLQQQALDRVKCLLGEAPALAFYDPKLPTVVSADASSFGLGAVLLQQQAEGSLKPVAYASRTLNAAESRYAQIEKELLASVWACEKFAQYLVGLESFKLETDHKPLIPLLETKGLDEAPVRCQRLLMRMMRFNAYAVHVPGKSLLVADALSRKPLANQSCELSELVEQHLEVVRAGWPVSPVVEDRIRASTQADPVLRRVAEYVAGGWPPSARSVPVQLLAYYRERGVLSILDGLVIKGVCITIPASMKNEVLERLHESHQGLTRTRLRARNAVWWPNISQDLKAISDACVECKTKEKAQNHEPLQPSEPATRPWQHVAMDLAQEGREDYLVLVDAYSRWIEVRLMRSTTTKAVVKALMEICSVHGLPEHMHFDNGRQFVSAEFKQWLAHMDMRFTESSPYFHQANGLVERAVQSAKKIMGLEDPAQGMLDYRSTPCTVTGFSPAQLLMGRQIRSRVPCLARELRPKQVAPETVQARDRLAKQRDKKYYDRRHGARELPKLAPGQPVLVRVDEQRRPWKKAATVLRDDGNRGYLIQGRDGGLYRRNRKHLLAVPRFPEAPLQLPDLPPVTRQAQQGAEGALPAPMPDPLEAAVPRGVVEAEAPPQEAGGQAVARPRREGVQPPARFKDFEMSRW